MVNAPQLLSDKFNVLVVEVCLSLACRRSGFNLIADCDFLCFTINRFANMNVHVHVYYSTVQGRPSQLMDSQFILKRNH